MASTSSKSQLSLSLLFLLFLVAEHAMTVGALDACDVVVAPLFPCLGAFSSCNGSHTPSTLCCKGAAVFANASDGTPLTVCECLKVHITRHSLQPQAVRNIFEKCNVTVPVPDPDTNCPPHSP